MRHPLLGLLLIGALFIGCEGKGLLAPETDRSLTQAAPSEHAQPRLAFDARLPDGTWEIFTMNSDGTDVVRLTNNPAQDLEPQWSPNGSMISWSRGGDVWIMNSDGSGQSFLVRGHGRHDWSPDGQIVFRTPPPPGGGIVPNTLTIVSSDGSVLRVISPAAENVDSPAWSPDGSEIAVGSSSGIVIIDAANGSLIRQLTTVPTDEAPAWSPNGQQIAFIRPVPSGVEHCDTQYDPPLCTPVRDSDNVMLINRDGSGERQLTFFVDALDHPTWSPNGSEIVFDTRSEKVFGEPEGEVWVVSVNSGNVNRITFTPSIREEEVDWGPRSPLGRSNEPGDPDPDPDPF